MKIESPYINVSFHHSVHFSTIKYCNGSKVDQVDRKSDFWKNFRKKYSIFNKNKYSQFPAFSRTGKMDASKNMCTSRKKIETERLYFNILKSTDKGRPTSTSRWYFPWVKSIESSMCKFQQKNKSVKGIFALDSESVCAYSFADKQAVCNEHEALSKEVDYCSRKKSGNKKISLLVQASLHCYLWPWISHGSQGPKEWYTERKISFSISSEKFDEIPKSKNVVFSKFSQFLNKNCRIRHWDFTFSRAVGKKLRFLFAPYVTWSFVPAIQRVTFTKIS